MDENKIPLNVIEQSSTTKSDGDLPQQSSRKKEIILQTDPNNLLYIINVLEKTLLEARTHRARNIVKNL